MSVSRHGFWAAVIAFMMVTTMLSCSNKTNQSDERASDMTADLKKIEQEVLDIHDEVMPKMGDLNNNRKKLIRQLYTQDSLVYGAQIRESVSHLEEADSLMWAWMHNYSRPDYNSDPDSVRSYLESELATVKVMRGKFFASLEESATLLEKMKEDDE